MPRAPGRAGRAECVRGGVAAGAGAAARLSTGGPRDWGVGLCMYWAFKLIILKFTLETAKMEVNLHVSPRQTWRGVNAVDRGAGGPGPGERGVALLCPCSSLRSEVETVYTCACECECARALA